MGREDRKKAQESFKHDPELQVFITTARGARRRPHQLRHSQLQNRRPHQAPPGSELLARHLPGERAACMPCGATSSLDLSLREHAGAEDGTAAADSGDRPNSGSLRLAEDPGAVEPRRLESREEAGVSAVPGRRLNAAAQAATEAACSAASPRALP